MKGGESENIPGKRNNCKGPKAEKRSVGSFIELKVSIPIWINCWFYSFGQLLISSYAMQIGFLIIATTGINTTTNLCSAFHMYYILILTVSNSCEVTKEVFIISPRCI